MTTFNVGDEVVLSSTRSLPSYPPGCYFCVCAQAPTTRGTDFGIFSRHEGNPPAAYTDEGRQGYIKLDGKHTYVLKMDRDMDVGPLADDMTCVHVQMINGEDKSLYGWILACDLAPRDKEHDDVNARKRAAFEEERRQAIQVLEQLKKEEPEVLAVHERNRNFILEQLRRADEDHAENMKWRAGEEAKLRRKVAEAEAAMKAL